MKTFATLTALSMILSLPLQAIGDDDNKAPNSPLARLQLLEKPPTYDDGYVAHRRPDTHSLAQDLVYVMTGWKIHEFESLSGEVLGCALKHAPLIFPSTGQGDAATFEDVKSLVALSVAQIEAVSEMRDVYFKKGTVLPSTTADTPKVITISHGGRGKIINELKSKTPAQIHLYGNAIRQCFRDFPICEFQENRWTELVTKLLSRRAEDIPPLVKALGKNNENLFPKRSEQTNLTQYFSEWYDLMMCLLSKTPDEIANLGNVMTAPPFTFERRTGTYYDDEVAKSLRMALYTKTPTELGSFVDIVRPMQSFLLEGGQVNKLNWLVRYPLDDLRAFIDLIQKQGDVLADKMKGARNYEECTLEQTQRFLKIDLLSNLSSIPLAESQRILEELHSQSWMNETLNESLPIMDRLFSNFISWNVRVAKEKIKAQQSTTQNAIAEQNPKTTAGSATCGATTSGE